MQKIWVEEDSSETEVWRVIGMIGVSLLWSRVRENAKRIKVFGEWWMSWLRPCGAHPTDCMQPGKAELNQENLSGAVSDTGHWAHAWLGVKGRAFYPSAFGARGCELIVCEHGQKKYFNVYDLVCCGCPIFCTSESVDISSMPKLYLLPIQKLFFTKFRDWNIHMTF